MRANRRSKIHLYPNDWKKLPVPNCDAEAQEPIIRVVDSILLAREEDTERQIHPDSTASGPGQFVQSIERSLKPFKVRLRNRIHQSTNMPAQIARWSIVIESGTPWQRRTG